MGEVTNLDFSCYLNNLCLSAMISLSSHRGLLLSRLDIESFKKFNKNEMITMTMLIFCIETSRATFRIRHVAPTVDGFTGTHPKQAIR